MTHDEFVRKVTDIIRDFYCAMCDGSVVYAESYAAQFGFEVPKDESLVDDQAELIATRMIEDYAKVAMGEARHD